MKILLTIIILFSTHLHSKEYISDFGFVTTIPEDYIVITEENLEETEEFLEDIEFDMSVWNSLIQYQSNEKGEILYSLDDLASYSEFTNNINFFTNELLYEELTSNSLDVFCPSYKNLLSDLANTEVEQLACNIATIPGIKGKSIYFEHYGMLPNILTIQYMFWISNKELIWGTLTCNSEDCIQDKIIFKDIISSMRRR